ncbi:thymidylate synthase [Candidatus Woesearchaeota archaeon]|nr:thymidylate synthase [Candidatus Woesearchaeota archaeon]
MNWPLYFEHNLIVGNPDSNVGVCTLWSEKEQLVERLPKELYAILGNLYSTKGMAYLVRNTLANPKIRYIVIFGKDLAESGEQFINFVNGEDIDLGIEKKHLDIFRKQVDVIDLRNKSFDDVLETLKQLKSKQTGAFGEPIILEEKAEQIPELPNENVNFIIREKQIAEAWPKMLDLIMKFGEIKETQYGMKEKELLNTVIIIEDEHQELHPMLKVSKKRLAEYLPTVLTANKPVGLNYTYGERLFSYKIEEYAEINQIQGVIEQLKKTPFTRRAVAMTWNVEKDRNSKHPPCLVYHHFLVRHGRLYLTAVIRSNDMFKAWPLNTLALNELLRYVCTETDIKYGNLTVVSNSAHIYETDWEEVKNAIKEGLKQNKILVLDPRGYFVIYLRDSKIIVEHFTNDNKKTGHIFVGSNAEEMYKEIIHENLISRQDHAAYVGKELMRAQLCLKDNKEFKQDSV